MKKQYEGLEINVLSLSECDVVTASGVYLEEDSKGNYGADIFSKTFYD